MIFVIYCLVIAACGLWTLRHELQGDGALTAAAHRDELADIFELPLPTGVEAYDVLATLDWIEAL